MRPVLRWIWLAAVAASLAVGARSTRAALAARPRLPFTPHASSDAFLAPAGGVRPAETLHRALSRLPADTAVVFVGPAEDPSYFLELYTVSLLALPRQVGGLGCRAGGGEGEVLVPLSGSERIAALVFFRRARMAPGSGAAERLKPDLVLTAIAPRSAASPWTSFCSSSPPRSS